MICVADPREHGSVWISERIPLPMAHIFAPGLLIKTQHHSAHPPPECHVASITLITSPLRLLPE